MKQLMLRAMIVFACLAVYFSCKSSDATKRNEKGASSRKVSEDKIAYEVVSVTEVKWEQLNPKRGKMSPKAADLWGGRKGKSATGFLVKFVDGFRSPPHIHNVSYRGIVLHGLVHNDDPAAANMWMPPGAFWTQPKGESHVTAAKGRHNVAYIEIERGPYLVLPKKKAFDSGERPINVDPSNMTWLDSGQISWMKKPGASAKGAKVAFLWGEVKPGKRNGSLVKVASGRTVSIQSRGSLLRGVIVKGQQSHLLPGKTTAKALPPGSYFHSKGAVAHQVTCKAAHACILYVRAVGYYRLSIQ